MVVRRMVVVSCLVVVSCGALFACAAFGGNDSSGVGGGAKDSGNADTGESTADGSAPLDGGGSPDGGGALDAGVDGCTTFVIPASADTYTLDDGNHCNSSTSFGNANPVHVRDVDAGELALVRFTLSPAQVQALGSSTVTVSSTTAACAAGPCTGGAFAMRSDWAESTGDSKGADLCRRDFPSGDWTAGANKPIAAPADYDNIAVGGMSFSSGVWSSTPMAPATLAQRLSDAGASGSAISLLLLTTSSSSLSFGAAGGNGPMTMTIRQCK